MYLIIHQLPIMMHDTICIAHCMYILSTEYSRASNALRADVIAALHVRRY